MKKLITVLMLFLSISVFAQERPSKRTNLSKEEMAILRAKSLSMQLDLTEQQEAQLKELFVKRIAARQELLQERKNSSEEIRRNRAEIRNERAYMNEEEKAELQKILNPEQYQKWEELQEKRRNGRKMPARNRDN